MLEFACRDSLQMTGQWNLSNLEAVWNVQSVFWCHLKLWFLWTGKLNNWREGERPGESLSRFDSHNLTCAGCVWPCHLQSSTWTAQFFSIAITYRVRLACVRFDRKKYKLWDSEYTFKENHYNTIHQHSKWQRYFHQDIPKPWTNPKHLRNSFFASLFLSDCHANENICFGSLLHLKCSVGPPFDWIRIKSCKLDANQ